MRSVSRLLMMMVCLMPVASLSASESGEDHLVAPSQAVAEAWARELRETTPVKTSGKALTGLQMTYAGLQAADMWTTIAARSRGAHEANPLMQGSYATGLAFKAAMSASTMLATRAIARKNRKAAVITMVVLNGATAAVVANNMRNARR